MEETISSIQELLSPIASEQKAINREAVKRRKIYDTNTIKKDKLNEFLANGWILDKELKTTFRVKKLKKIDERLENRLWMLFYKLGYPELNESRNFKISIQRKGAKTLLKQIDVFARDEETVIIAECKTTERIRKKSLQKDIEEFANLKGPIFQAIKEYYGRDYKPKIISFFVTENIIWSTPDKERALGQNIRIITERELRYYIQIAEHLGHAARYQFLAEFLKGQQIPGLKDLIVPATRGSLGGHKFYSFVTTPRHLLKISFVNHRSLNDPEGAPTYQRLISRSRMKQIATFLSEGGFFPTNILVNFVTKVRFDISKKDPKNDVTFGYLYLPEKYQSVWIIDGQHRLYGFAHADPKLLDQNIIVIAFDGLSTEQEAHLFVTINHEQKTVPKTLLDDLEGELKWGSNKPHEKIGAMNARLIGILNNDIGEPFHNRVVQQGIKTTDRVCLTVPAIKEALKKSTLLGSVLFNRKVYKVGPFSGSKDSETVERARCGINQYFTLIRDSNFKQWEKGRLGYLSTNVAIQAYVLLLSSLIKYMETNKGLDAHEMQPQEIIMEIEEYLEPVLTFLSKAKDSAMEKEFKVQYGTGGHREYFFRLCRIVKQEVTDFNPDGMSDWDAEQSDEKIENADRQIKELNIKIQSYIFSVFKSKYGIDNDAYWNKGVIDKKIRINAYQKSLDDDDDNRLPLENYLDFIDYKKIVENKYHWLLFKQVFNIPEPGEKGYSKNLQWMDKINKIRRIPAHSTEQRRYQVEDFDYIDFVYEEFMLRYNSVNKDD